MPERKQRKSNKGQFRKGADPRRHKFTTEERQRGFQNALVSIITRYPNAIGTDGRHMACRFLSGARRQA